MSRATGQDSGIRIDHYAAMRGEQVGTVRKRIQRGQLAAYKGSDHRWYILEGVPSDATGDATGHDTRQDTTAGVTVNSNARAQLEAIRDEWLQPLVETIARQAEQIGRLQAERDGATSQLLAKDQAIANQDAALTAKDETIAELRRRAEAAETALAAREAATPSQAAPEAPESPRTPARAQVDAPGVWGRLRHWWRG